jgi:excisionase family DNA binding protein
MSDRDSNRIFPTVPADAGTDSRADAPQQPGPGGFQPLLWDLAECAAALSVSARTVKRMAAAGELPGVVHLGRCRRFDRRRIELWIADGCPPPRGAGRVGRR